MHFSLNLYQRFARADLRIQLLSVISAAADVMAFLEFHEVFTSAMTGNLALLGISLGQGHFMWATHSFLALIGFVVGVGLASSLGHRHFWRQDRILFLELGGLLLFAAAWWAWGFPNSGPRLGMMIFLAAMAMRVQSVLARRINVAGVPSVVFTNTLTSIFIGVSQALQKRQRPDWVTVQQVAALLAYTFGAILVATLLCVRPAWAVDLPWLLLLIVWGLGRETERS